MKRSVIALWLLLLASFAMAQVPQGYYLSAEGAEGEDLKQALYLIIKGHTRFPYTSTNTDTWDILKLTDKDPLNPANVILLYSGLSVDAAQEYNNAQGWTREHVWAKSRGDFGTTLGAGTDVHHLRPENVSVNSARNNRWFDSCTVPVLYNGVPTGSYTSTTEWVFQPRAAVKGDVARMIFYMATRYEGENGEPDLEMIDYLPADNNTNLPVHARLSTLLRWHQEDPVDDWERNRNDIIYGFQRNRNPFIDFPEYAELIWGTKTAIEVSDDEEQGNDLVIYPNPTSGLLFIDRDGEFNITVITQNGLVAKKATGNSVDLSGLSPGVYFVRVSDLKGKVIKVERILLGK